VVEPGLRRKLEERGLKILIMSGSDGFIPEASLRVLAPSLHFAVARKAAQESGAKQ
jgi:hypothetical protein